MFIAIGSYALKQLYPSSREPNDIDLVATSEKDTLPDLVPSSDPLYLKTLAFSTPVELDISLQTSNLMLRDFIVDKCFFHGIIINIPCVEALYAVKRSHVNCLPNSFGKSIKDILFMKDKIDLNKMKEVEELLRTRKEETKNRVKKQNNLKFNKSNKSFFEDYVDRKYDHDWLHEVVSYYERPLHESIRKDENSPLCSKDKFFSLSYTDQLRCANEEIMTISLERILIPGITINHKIAFDKAKMIVASRLTRNWFQDFIIDNYENLTPDFNYWEVFRNKEKELLNEH